jgi:hypothetical protein
MNAGWSYFLRLESSQRGLIKKTEWLLAVTQSIMNVFLMAQGALSAIKD